MPASRLYSPSGTPQSGGGDVDQRADEIITKDFDFSQFVSVLPNQSVPDGRQIIHNETVGNGGQEFSTFYSVCVSSITGKVYTVGYSGTQDKSFLDIIHPTDAGYISVPIDTLIPTFTNGTFQFIADELGNVYMFVSGNGVDPKCFKILPDNTVEAYPVLDFFAFGQSSVNYKEGYLYSNFAAQILKTDILTGLQVVVFDANNQGLPIGYGNIAAVDEQGTD